VLYKTNKYIEQKENRNMTLGERIRAIRQLRGLSQTELGERIGLNADRVQKYENGTRKPKEPLTKAIAKALAVDERVMVRPNFDSPLGFIQILMDVEDDFGLNINELKNGDISISFEDELLNKRLKDWNYKRKLITNKNFKNLPEEVKVEIKNNYYKYKVCYPTYELGSLDDDVEINNLKKYIEILEMRLNQLENDRNKEKVITN
jgi:Predicted transcription factor, homolog of eukaryotic MBF1